MPIPLFQTHFDDEYKIEAYNLILKWAEYERLIRTTSPLRKADGGSYKIIDLIAQTANKQPASTRPRTYANSWAGLIDKSKVLYRRRNEIAHDPPPIGAEFTPDGTVDLDEYGNAVEGGDLYLFPLWSDLDPRDLSKLVSEIDRCKDAWIELTQS